MTTTKEPADRHSNSTISVPEPPSPIALAPNIYSWRAGDPLHRVWNKKFAANAFNPGVGAPTRFAPIKTMEGRAIPTLYAGSTLECAFFERIFHDVRLEPQAMRTVHVNKIEDLLAGTIVPGRVLNLAQLFRPDLERWGLKRSELVHSEADAYNATAKWAAALHRDFAHLDGLIWTSNRCDPALAVVLFGDRCEEFILTDDPGEEILHSAQLLKLLNDCAERANIRIARS